jgi:hypothetical protein
MSEYVKGGSLNLGLVTSVKMGQIPMWNVFADSDSDREDFPCPTVPPGGSGGGGPSGSGTATHFTYWASATALGSISSLTTDGTNITSNISFTSGNGAVKRINFPSASTANNPADALFVQGCVGGPTTSILNAGNGSNMEFLGSNGGNNFASTSGAVGAGGNMVIQAGNAGQFTGGFGAPTNIAGGALYLQGGSGCEDISIPNYDGPGGPVYIDCGYSDSDTTGTVYIGTRQTPHIIIGAGPAVSSYTTAIHNLIDPVNARDAVNLRTLQNYTSPVGMALWQQEPEDPWVLPAGALISVTSTAADPGRLHGRLSAVTNTAIPSSDQTAVTTLYLTAYQGNKYTTYNGSVWTEYSLGSDLTIGVTTASNNFSYTSGSPNVTMLTGDTTQLVPGMFPTGVMLTDFSGFGILKITGSTTFVMAGNSSNTRASQASTFQLVGSCIYDIFLVDNSGSPQLRFGNKWTNLTTRADALGFQDGVDVNNANIVMGSGGITSIQAKQGKLIGCIYTTSNGQTQDAESGRYIVNLYNQKPHNLIYRTTTNTTTTSTTFVQISSVQISTVSIKGEDQVSWRGQCPIQNQNSTDVGVLSIGTGPTTEASNAISSEEYSGVGGADLIPGVTKLDEYLAAGVTTRYLIGRASLGTTIAFYGQERGSAPQMMLRATVYC